MVRRDSKLFVNQVMKAIEPRYMWMCAYYSKVRKLEERLKGFELHQSYRCFNIEAYELSTIASGQKPILDEVFTSDIHEPSIKII